MISKKISLLILILSINQLEPKIVIMSVPKSGTHFIEKLVHLFLQKDYHRIYASPFTLLNGSFFTNKKYNVQFAHPIFIKENSGYLSRENVKGIFVIRDPRDQIISMAYMVKKNKSARPYWNKKKS